MEDLSNDESNRKRNTAQAQRMRAIIDGFTTLNIPISLISGSRRERRKQALNFILKKKYKSVSKVYVETSNSGILFYEAILLLICKLNRIPIGVYIRDAHAKFFEYWIEATLKERISYTLWWLSLILYRFTANVFFYPSERFGRVMKIKGELLPPALPILDDNCLKFKENTIFYVGGVGKVYDLDSFLLACKKLKEERDITVNIFCRKTDVYKLDKWRKSEWLSIEHKNIRQLDYKPQIAVIPLAKTRYADLAYPVKLLDYLALKIPIIATNNATLNEVIIKNKIGLIVKSGAVKEYYSQIKRLLDDRQLYNQIILEMEKANKSEQFSWMSRCKKVISELGKYE